MNEDIFKGVGVEVELTGDDSFLLTKETLTRIGILSKKENVLWQSCNILHRRGRYVILSFKELFVLDGKCSPLGHSEPNKASLTENDIQRRNTIAMLLDDWGLVKIKPSEYERIKDNLAPLSQIKIISYKDKELYELKSKYTVGRKRN
jgi:hypothetical protein